MSKKKKNQKFFKKNRVRKYWRMSLTLSFLVILLYGASFWSAHESLNIKELEVKGNKYISTEKVEEVFWNEIDGNYLSIFSKSNFIIFPKKIISTKLKRELSVKDVFITVDPNKAVVEIIEHEGVGEYCIASVCYLMNKDGLIFALSPLVTMEEYTRFSGDIEGDILGQTYSGIDNFRDIYKTIELLEKIDVFIKTVTTEDYQTFTLQSLKGPYLLIDDNDDPVELVNNLKTTLEQEAIHDVQFGNLEYIDLRFGNKVYYKIK